MTPRELAAALSIPIIWGLNFVAIRYALDDFEPVFLAGLRFVVSAFPLLWVRPPASVRFRWIVATGLTMGVLQFSLLFLAMEHGLSPGLASIVLQTHVGLTVLIAAVALHERPSRLQLAGVAAALGGLVLLAVARGGSATLLGLGLCVGAALGWAIGNVITRHVRPAEPFAFIVWFSAIPPLPLFALSLIVDDRDAVSRTLETATLRGIAAVLYIGIVSTLVGYVIWSWLLRRHPASRVVPFALLVPVVGMSASAVVFGERYSAGQLAGAAVIVAGVALASGAVLARPGTDAGPEAS